MFDLEKCQKEIFAPLPAIFLAGLLTKLSRMKTRPLCFSQQVGRELGVRYVLEGSVRKAAHRVRITAQLVDARTGHHLWAERYDRDLKDIFAIQDEITKKIIAALQVKLTQGEEARIWAKGTDNLEAYEKWLQARDYHLRTTKEGYAMSRQLCEEAIALDPEWPPPYAMMGMAHILEARLGYSKSRRRSMERAFELVQKALELDVTLGYTHGILAYIYRQKRQYGKAIEEAERAIALNPNSAFAYWCLAACQYPTGRPDEAIASVKKAMRLNPLSPWHYFYLLGQANWVMEQYKEAIAAYKKAIQRKPDNLYSHISLTASYSLLGREEEAHAEAAEVLRIHRKFSVDHIAKTLPFKNQADTERYVEALRKAGLK